MYYFLLIRTASPHQQFHSTVVVELAVSVEALAVAVANRAIPHVPVVEVLDYIAEVPVVLPPVAFAEAFAVLVEAVPVAPAVPVVFADSAEEHKQHC